MYDYIKKTISFWMGNRDSDSSELTESLESTDSFNESEQERNIALRDPYEILLYQALNRHTRGFNHYPWIGTSGRLNQDTRPRK